MGGNPKVIVATPDIKSFRVVADHDFILLGCDGIFDKLSSRDTIQIVWSTALYAPKSASVHQVCGDAAQAVVQAALERKSLDNVTVLIIALSPFKARLRALRQAVS
jgi:protein phosphatase 2C family protein 2/3